MARPTRTLADAEAAFLAAWAALVPNSGSNKGRLESLAALHGIEPAAARKLLKYRRHREHYLGNRRVKK